MRGQGRKAVVLVLSPHFDDAVLSCSHALTASKAVVVNVFSGAPPPPACAQWDRLGGFHSSEQAAAARALEDEAALGVLGATADPPRGLLENQYENRTPEDTRRLVAEVTVLVRSYLPQPGTMTSMVCYAPLALSPSPHPDHVIAREAAVSVAGARCRVRLYADQPHCFKGGPWPRSINPQGGAEPAWWNATLDALPLGAATVVRLAPAQVERKANALRCYTSQLKALRSLRSADARRALHDPACYGTEAFWEVAR